MNPKKLEKMAIARYMEGYLSMFADGFAMPFDDYVRQRLAPRPMTSRSRLSLAVGAAIRG